MLCYHKEYFTLGFLGAFFIFVVVSLFEDVIGKGIKRMLKKIDCFT